MKMNKTLLSTLIAVLASVAYADEFTVDAPVQEAVLYHNLAEVTRQVKVDVHAAGHHRIIVPHSLTKDAAKLRPVVKGAELHSVSTVPNWFAKPSDLDEEIETITVQLDVNEHEMSVNNTLVQGLSDSLAGQGDYQEVQAKIQRLNTAYADLAVERAALHKKLAALRAKQDWQGGNAKGAADQLVFEVDVADAGEVEITWQAQTNQAYWQPSSDWMLDTKAHTLSLAAQANVIQKTGLDWQSAVLTLAVVPPQYLEQPYLDSQIVRAIDPKESVLRDAPMALSAAPAIANMEYAEKSAPAPVISSSGVDFRVALPGQYDIPSGMTGRSIGYWQGKVDAEIYSAVYDWSWPQNTALLMAEWTMPKALNILPGNMTLYRDGNVITQRNEHDLINAGSKQTLSFGIDPQLAVNISNPPGYTANHGLISKSHSLSQRATVSVTNNAQQEKRVRVFSRLPVSVVEDVEVSAEWSPKPTEQNVDDIRGLNMWEKTLTPGEQWSIQTGFDIDYPEGKELIGL